MKRAEARGARRKVVTRRVHVPVALVRRPRGVATRTLTDLLITIAQAGRPTGHMRSEQAGGRADGRCRRAGLGGAEKGAGEPEVSAACGQVRDGD